MRSASVLPWILAAGLIAGDAAAGVIRGTLHVSRHAARAAFSPPDAVIYVGRVPDKVERKLTGHGWFSSHPPEMPRLVLSDLRFSPRVLVVAAGTQAEFENRGSLYHKVFGVSGTKRFALGKGIPGGIDTLTFAHAEFISLFCEIHPEEIGFIAVVPNHAFAHPDSTGAFVLPELPNGRYTVKAWLPGVGETSRGVEIRKRGDVNVQLKF
jgi:hypothetical protein